MYRFLTGLFLVISLSACAPAATTSPTEPPVNATATTTPSPSIPLPTEWAGAITHADGSTESIIVKFTEEGGTLTVEPNTKAFPISDFQQTDATVSFKVEAQNGAQFTGAFNPDQMTGQVEQSGQTGSFTLLPLGPESNPALDDFTGTYQFKSGEALLINLAPEYSSSGLYFFGQGLMVTHFGNGAIRALYPIAEDTFLVGSARAIGYPFGDQITFTRDSSGNVSGLTWQARDPKTGELGQPEQAARLALTSEVVHFTSEDGTNLTGLLTLPATPAPYPAIMMLHGSERGTKDDFGDQQMSAFMASQGIAILTYDKRGVGDSGGHYSESASGTNLKFTAQDAIAGIEYLKGRPEIQADKIGLTGFSQAGWVIPLAASQSSDIAYFIILSGPVTSVGHENLYSAFTSNGDSPTSYSQEELMSKLASAPHSGFDSTPIIADLNQHGLWIFGDQDKSIPVPECVDNLKDIIANGKANFTYVVLPNADHNLQQTTQGLFIEIPYSPGYQADYYKTMAHWLEENIKQ